MDSTYSAAESQDQTNEWIRFGLRLGVSAALHPFEYSKVLIQLGYEPTPPRPGRSVFGRNTLYLPNIFEYVRYVRRVDGFSGMYRGLAPKLVGSIVGSMFSERVADKLGLATLVLDDSKDESELSPEEKYKNFEIELKRDIVIHVSGIIITHPFHVISLRMMAQFIGRETTYTSILGSIVEVYRNDGIFGFFSGIVPKILCDLLILTLTSGTVYIVNKHFVREKDSQSYFANFIQFVYASILYPLQVVSTCMAVTGSGLNAGKPPYMPVYDNWVDCWHDLKTRGELKRGSSLFFRTVRSNSYFNNKYTFAPLPSITKYN